MRIGVVIPGYNAARWIGAAIASVLAQTQADWRLVVVDDGSTDETGAIAGGIRDPRIRLVRQANAGVAAARNRGVAELSDAICDAFLFLDADDSLAPGALPQLIEALETAPLAVAAVGPWTFSDARQRHCPRAAGDVLGRLLVRNLFANCGPLLIRAVAFHASGGFRPGLVFGEDWEFCIRLALQGSFVAVRGRSPVLFVRRHDGGAYHRLAADPASFEPCMQAIFANPGLRQRFGADRLATIRRRTEAENAWIIGRELIRHGETRIGRTWLLCSVRAAPSVKRAALLGASLLRIGPFAPYLRANLACSEPTSPCGRKMMNTTSNVP
jgi:glycosyltransferase involved in cell wall biosynthesis